MGESRHCDRSSRVRHRRIGWLLVVLCWLTATSLSAATCTWSGANGDNQWATAGNWDTVPVPGNGDALIFPSGVTFLAPNNNFAGGSSFASITFNVGAGNYVISGNAFTLSGGATAITNNTTSGTMTISNAITFTGASTITDVTGGSLTLTGTIANGGGILTLAGGGLTTISNVISGTGGLTVNTGVLDTVKICSAANTFTGNTTITFGGLRIANSSGLGIGPNTITMTNGTTGQPSLRLNGSGGAITLASDITFTTSTNTGNYGGIINESGANVINGNFTLTSGGGATKFRVDGGTLTVTGTITPNTTLRQLTLDGAGNGTFSGLLQDGGGANIVKLLKQGTGTWTLGGANTYTDTTIISAGTLEVTGSTAVGSAVTVNTGGTLSGTGSVAGTVTVANGGTLSPGVGGTLVASFVASSLRAVTQDDWRATQTITGTRTDQIINQPGNAFGTAAERAAFGIGGNAGDWDNFSVQWDGYLRVTTAGTTLSTRSDDGSRVWLDLNGNGVVDSGEWGSNGWGTGQGETTRTVHAGLAVGTYRMRVQYEEGNGGNAMYLLWSDAANSAGTVAGLYLVPENLLLGGSTIGTLATGAVTMNGTSTYAVDLHGTVPTFDQVSTAGAVTCAGTLTVGSIVNPALGKVYTIIAAGSVSGTFSGLANGDLFYQQGRTFQIAYDATTVTLTDVVHPTTRIWDGGGADNNWTTAANWNFNIAPVAGDDLQFAGSTRLTPNNDFPVGTSFASITFNSGAGAFIIGPSAISTGTISREVWTGVGGTTIASIPTGTAPNISDTLSIFEGPTDWADNYGTRIRGFITAPTTGNYTFWVASDDNGQLWLSTDTQAANKVLIASVPNWTASRAWGTDAAQKSAAIALIAGQKYYVEALQKEGGGGDNLAVGWAKPGEPTTAPSEVIPGAYLSPYGNGYEIVLAGNITNNSSNLQTVNLGLSLAATRTVDCASANVALGGIISGAGGLTKIGANTLTLTGTHTYTGVTTISVGTLQIGNGTTDGSIATSSGITNNAALIYNLSGSQAYGNVISGSGTVTKSGAGTLTLAGANTYTGATTISAGTLLVTGSTAAGSAVAVSSGATLGGTGTISGPITMGAGGILAPGTGGTTIGTLATADVACNATSVYSVDLDGTTPTADRDTATGTATITGTLTVASIANAAYLKTYTILSATTVTGTFTGLPDRTVFTQLGRNFLISYSTTTVTLTDIDPAYVWVWDGGGTDDNWRTDANWVGDVAPGIGAALQFAGTTRLTPNNNFTADTSFASITFNSGAGAFTIGGNRITLTGGVTNNDDSVQTLNQAMIMAATRTVNAASGDISIGGILSGAGGLAKTGAGTLTLGATNTFTGGLTITAGVLSVAADVRLGAVPGSATPGSITLNGGTLQFTGAAAITLNANRGIALGSSGGTINIAIATTAAFVGAGDIGVHYSGIIADVASQSGSLTVSGVGMLMLYGSSTYSGTTTVDTGWITYPSSGGPYTNVLPITTVVNLINGGRFNFCATSSVQSVAGLTGDATGLLGTTNQGSTVTLTLNETANYVFPGIIGPLVHPGKTGTNTRFALTKSGSGTQTLSGANTYTGATTVNAGTLLVTGSTAASAVSVASGATLGGTGTVGGTITMGAGGILAPGTGGATIGTLSTAAVTCNATSIYSVDLDGTTPTADRDTATGTATITGTLTVASIANAAYLKTYTILSATTVTGTFTGLPDRTVFTQLGRNFLISYSTTTVTLTDIDPAYVWVWDGGGTDDNWRTDANWVGDVAPGIGAALQFAGTTRLTPNNNFTADTSFASITFNSGAGAFTIGGNRITLTGDVTNNDDSAQTLNTAMIMAATRTVNAASGDISIGGILSGAGGLTKTGAGTLILSGTNTFTGITTISAGTLQVGNGTTDGSIATSASITDGAALVYNLVGAQTFANVISGTGTLTKTGAGVLTLSGAAANTYSGLTSVTGGRLHLNKTAGVDAIAGNLSVADGMVSFGAFNQIADASAVTMSGAASIFNGTGVNLGQYTDMTETIASLTVTGGCFNLGTGPWTVTGALSFTGGTGNSVYLGNSGSRMTTGSLSLTAMTATAGGTVGLANSFTVYGNTATRQSFLSVGAGGITLDGSKLNLRRGGAGALGSKLVLDGGITTSGSSASSIIEDTNGGTTGGLALELSSTAGAATRTATVAAGGADLIIGVPITDGAATPGALTKAGTGTLTLNGTLANTFTGVTTVNDGTVVLQKTTGVTAIAGNISLGNAAGSDVLRLGASDQIADTAVITFTSGGGGNSAKLELNGYLDTVAGIQSNANQASVIQNTESGAAAGANNPAILTVTNTANYVYDGLIRNGGGGTIGLTKAGSGTLTLACGFGSASTTYSGATTVSAGRLVIDNLSGFSSAITGNSAAADGLTFNQGSQNLSLAVGISGTGAVTKTGTGTLTLTGTKTYTGITTISAGTLQIGNGTTDGSIATSSGITDNAALIYNLIGSQTYTNVIGGTGTLSKSGVGTLTLSGTNTYGGTSTVNAGTLLVTGATAAGSAMTVNSGGTLGGTGTVAGTVGIANGGTLAPGTGGTTIGALTTGAVTCNTSSTYGVDLNGTTPTYDQINTSGAVTCAGTLTVTSIANAAVGRAYPIITAGTLSGTFAGLPDNTLFVQAGRLFRITYSSTTATLTDFAPSLTGRQTLDVDGDGQIDRIRLTFDQALNDDTSGLTVTVAGYAVIGYSTGTSNDAVIDVLLTESGAGDTGVTPAVRITVNSTLTYVSGTGTVQVEGSGTAATDTAAPVLLSSLWTDGDANGVDAGDTLALTFSEAVATSSMVFGDLGLPVTADSLGGTAATAVADQSGSATVSFALSTTPALSPGGAYSSLVLGANKPSGIFLAVSAHVSDLATVPNGAATGNVASAVDVDATPSTLIRIEWNDTHDTIAKTWALGAIDLSSVSVSGTYTILNAGHSSVSLSATSSDSAAWTVQPVVGSDAFAMKANADVNPDFELTLSTVALPIPTTLRSGSIFDFSLQFSAPSTASTSAMQTVVVTITASQY